MTYSDKRCVKTGYNKVYKSWRHSWYLIFIFRCAATPYTQALAAIYFKKDLTNKLLTIGLILIATQSYSQSNDSTQNFAIRNGDKYLSLLFGYNGWTNNFGELGLAKNQLNEVGPHPLGWTLFASTEFKLSTHETIIGPKIGVWAGGGVGLVAVGLCTIYYTDFDKGTWRLRPEIGFGLDRFKLVYGYNIPLTNKEFDKINESNISLTVLLQIKKMKSGGK